LNSLPNDIEKIDIHRMNLTYIPPLDRFTKLQILYCSNNELTNLPILPDKLEILDCSDNELTEFPNLPNTLKYLDCSYNKLTELPQLPNTLENLDCSYNQLTELPNLPDTLENLICSYNKITTLPELPITLKHFCCLDNNLPFEDIESWRTFNKFKSTYYKLKYGKKLEKYYIKNIRNRCINKEVIDVVYSPDYNFYKRLLDPNIRKMFS
jgi:Leucine-rich repeat (LRR) protein